MGRPFRRTRTGIRVQLDLGERSLLARLLEDVDQLLAQDAAERATAPADDDPADRSEGGESDADVLAALEASLSVPPPDDPAVSRLLPSGHRDDDELAASFRRLTEQGLRDRKRAGLELASAALVRPDPVILDKGEAAALLKGMTDVRLVLAERLGLRTDEDAERLHAVLAGASDFDDPRIAAAALYDALTWWQEALVTTLR